MTRPMQALMILISLLLILAGCGGATEQTATPLPPTVTSAPTRTPAPTVAVTPTPAMEAMTLEQLQEREAAIVAELAIEQRHMYGASGFEGAQVQEILDRLNRELREVRELIEATGSAEATEAATSEAGS